MANLVKQLWSIRVLLIMFLSPLILLPLPLQIGTQEAKTAYVLILMAVFWITEVVPISVTALLPVFMFPMLGIIKAKEIAPAYMSDTIMVFIGGLIMAVAIETWNIHRLMALRVLMIVGAEPRWLMLGLMISTWFLSMWISNSATTAMMLPISQAILVQLKGTKEKMHENEKSPEEKESIELTDVQINGKTTGNEPQTDVQINGRTIDNEQQADVTNKDEDAHYKRTCKAMSLCIAYAANSGGICSLTGTGPNLVLKGHADEIYAKYGEESPINFTSWMGFGLPLGFTIFIICWIWLQIAFLRCRGGCGCCSSDEDKLETGKRVKQVIRDQYDALGPITYAQCSVLVMFSILVVCWISRDLGGVGGWGDLFQEGYVKDSTPAILLAVLLFVLPAEKPAIFCWGNNEDEKPKPTRALLTWKDAHEKLPWSLFLLLGGGFALAKGCQESGLSVWIGEQLEVFKDLNPWLMLLILCYVCSFFTEVTSNVAIATIIMPILSSLAINTGVNPMFYILPAAISTSFAYMLPVATPPNALVFSYGHLKVIDMASAGFILNIIAVPLLVFAAYTWGNAIFDFDTVPPGFLLNQTATSNLTRII